MSIAYWLLVAVHFVLTYANLPGDGVLRNLPILLLACSAIAVYRAHGKFLSAALVFSIAGDIALGRVQLVGVIFYAIAHLFYITCFWPYIAISAKKLLAIAPVVIFAGFMSWKLWSSPVLSVPALRGGIFAYITIITIMTASAILGSRKSLRTPAGALVFMASDSLIAWNSYITPIPYQDSLIMGTYYLAQYLIATGYMRQVKS